MLLAYLGAGIRLEVARTRSWGPRSDVNAPSRGASIDVADFEAAVVAHRRELEVHCYRMLGSMHDAEDALQETWIAAWRGLPGFEGRSSLRTWLYRIATRCCIRRARDAQRRLLSWEHASATSPDDDLGEPHHEPMWVEPFPTGPEDAAIDRDTIALAYVAALQHLPPNQRAVLVLRDVLTFSAAEVSAMLDASPAAVNSALQRARATLAARQPLRGLPASTVTAAERNAVRAFMAAWEAADVAALAAAVSADVAFTMPPIPAWFDGRDDVCDFVVGRTWTSPWRLLAVESNRQPAVACYQLDGSVHRLGAVNVLAVRAGRVCWIAGFVEPRVVATFGLPPTVQAG